MGEIKIKTLEDLETIIRTHQTKSEKVVLCHGCFDLVHYGHVRHFQDAKKQGDVLVVTVTPDEFIEKGPGRPFFNQDQRLEQLAAQQAIDYVALNRWPMAVDTIRFLKPDVYAKGREVLGNKDIDAVRSQTGQRSNLSLEIEAIEAIGGRFYLTDEASFSSSTMINNTSELLSPEAKAFLAELKSKYKQEYLLQAIKDLEGIRVLLIGDSIFDEYVFCRAMEKSAKDPLISHIRLGSETHLGGVFAVANNMFGFCRNLSLLTCLGDEQASDKELLERDLNNGIRTNFLIEPGKRILKKTRFVDEYSGRKIFQAYDSPGIEISSENQRRLLEYLLKQADEFDAILVSDYGNGFITPEIISALSKTNKFLGVSCQLTGGNLGYNFVTKYPRTDFVSVNEREIRLPFQERTSSLQIPMQRLADSHSAKRVLVTSGKLGCTYYENKKFSYSPTFVREPVDTMGAGDAVFSLTSLLAYRGTGLQLIPFFANSIGGLAVRIMGNKKPIGPAELNRFVSYILR